MKIRTDVTAAIVTVVLVVAIVVLTITDHAVPELLTVITAATLGIYGGAVVPTHLAGSPAAAAAADLPAEVPSSSTPARKISGPAPMTSEQAAAEVARVQAAHAVPAPRPAGRDWTEEVPKITPELLAAYERDRA